MSDSPVKLIALGDQSAAACEGDVCAVPRPAGTDQPAGPVVRDVSAGFNAVAPINVVNVAVGVDDTAPVE